MGKNALGLCGSIIAVMRGYRVPSRRASRPNTLWRAEAELRAMINVHARDTIINWLKHFESCNAAVNTVQNSKTVVEGTMMIRTVDPYGMIEVNGVSFLVDEVPFRKIAVSVDKQGRAYACLKGNINELEKARTAGFGKRKRLSTHECLRRLGVIGENYEEDSGKENQSAGGKREEN